MCWHLTGATQVTDCADFGEDPAITELAGHRFAPPGQRKALQAFFGMDSTVKSGLRSAQMRYGLD